MALPITTIDFSGVLTHSYCMRIVYGYKKLRAVFCGIRIHDPLRANPQIIYSNHSADTAPSFFYQPLSVRGWTSAFLLAVHRLCGVIEGRLSHFMPRWLRTGWQSAISQGKSLEILCHG